MRQYRNLCRLCEHTCELSSSLRKQILSLKLPSRHFSTRVERAFWQSCESFFESCVNLVNEVQKEKEEDDSYPELVPILRQLHESIQVAARLIQDSRWSQEAD